MKTKVHKKTAKKLDFYIRMVILVLKCNPSYFELGDMLAEDYLKTFGAYEKES